MDYRSLYQMVLDFRNEDEECQVCFPVLMVGCMYSETQGLNVLGFGWELYV